MILRLNLFFVALLLALISNAQEWSYLPDPVDYDRSSHNVLIQTDLEDHFISSDGGGNHFLFSKEGSVLEKTKFPIWLDADTLWGVDSLNNLIYRPLVSRSWRFHDKLDLPVAGFKKSQSNMLLVSNGSYFFYDLDAKVAQQQYFIWQGDTLLPRWYEYEFDNQRGLYFQDHDELFYFKDSLQKIASPRYSIAPGHRDVLKKSPNGDIYYCFDEMAFLKFRNSLTPDTLDFTFPDLVRHFDWGVHDDLINISFSEYTSSSIKPRSQIWSNGQLLSDIGESFRFITGGSEPLVYHDNYDFRVWKDGQIVSPKYKQGWSEKSYLGGNEGIWIIGKNQVLLFDYATAKYEIMYDFNNGKAVRDVKRLSRGLAVNKGDSIYMISEDKRIKIHGLSNSQELTNIDEEHYIQTLGASVYFTIKGEAAYEWNWEEGLTKLTNQANDYVIIPLARGTYFYKEPMSDFLQVKDGVISTVLDSINYLTLEGLTTDRTRVIFQRNHPIDQTGSSFQVANFKDSYLGRVELGLIEYQSRKSQLVISNGGSERRLNVPDPRYLETVRFSQDGRIVLSNSSLPGVHFSSRYDLNNTNLVEIANKDLRSFVYADGTIGIDPERYTAMRNASGEALAGSISPVIYAQHNNEVYYSAAEWQMFGWSHISPGVSDMGNSFVSNAAVLTKSEVDAPNDEFDLNNLLRWPAVSDPEGNYKDEPFAPFIDVNNNGYYDPSAGDKPKIIGHATAYLIGADLQKNKLRRMDALEVELHTMVWAIEGSECLDRSLFYRYTLVNRSGRDYDSLMLGQFLYSNGNAYLERFGCDTAANSSFYYPKSDNSETNVWGITYLNNDLYRFNMAEQGGPTGLTYPGDRDQGMIKTYFNAYFSNGDSMKYENERIRHMFPGDPVKDSLYTQYDYRKYQYGPENATSTFGSTPFVQLKSGERKHFDFVVNWVDSDTGTHLTNINLFKQCVQELKDEYAVTDLNYSGASVAHPNPYRLSAEEYEEESDFRLYPNPSQGKLSFTDHQNWKLKSVHNVQGQEMNFRSRLGEIEIKAAQSGMYNLIFENKVGEWKSKRIIID